MSDQAIGRIDADPGSDPASGRRSAWWPRLRLGFEFALLFAIAGWLGHSILPGMGGVYPNPLWIPVVVLSLQYGLGAAIAAAAVAGGFYVWDGLPPAALSEDLYQYIARVAAEPIGWTCVALLFGHVRHRQIDERAELSAELVEREKHCTAVAAHCNELKSRAEMLERHIATNALSSHVDIAEAIAGLHQANWQDFAQRLTRFVMVMTGSAEFSLYLKRDDALKLAFQARDENTIPADAVVGPSDPVFPAVVDERRTLLATRPRDREVLDERASLAGPIVEDTAANRVIGMLRIGGADLADFPEDIERRFTLTCAEIARLLGRVILIETQQPAPAPAMRPVSRLEQAHALVRRAAAPAAKTLDQVAG